MGFLEKTGKNVDEALEQALNELKTTPNCAKDSTSFAFR